MKKEEKTVERFHAIGKALEGLIMAALPDSEASVRYDNDAEYFYVTTYGRKHDVSVVFDGPRGALVDIAEQLLSKKL